MKKNILRLYSEDFEKSHTWRDICDILSVPYSADSISIEFGEISFEYSSEDDLNPNNQ
jgi:hypothetical protein